MNNISYWKNLVAAFRGKEPSQQSVDSPFYFGFVAGSNMPNPKMTINYTKLRAFSESPIPRRAIDYIKNQVSMLEWGFVSEDGKPLTDQQLGKAKVVKNILKKPNRDDSFRTFIEKMAEDMLVIGYSSNEKVPWPQNKQKPMVIHPFDASSLLIYNGWNGEKNKPRYAQVSYFNGYQVDFYNDQIMYVPYNPRTNTPWGLSPLEVAAQTTEYLLSTQSFAGRLTSSASLRKLLDLGEEIDQQQVKEIRQWWRDEVEGRGHMPIIGGTKGAKSIELGASNDEALFLKWQGFLINQIANCFGMDSQKFGAVLASRATGDILDDATDEGAVRPLADSIAAAINRDILQPLGFHDIEFVFRFTTNLKDRKSLAAVHQIYLTNDAWMIDEVRAETGKPPLPDGKGQMTLAEYRSKFGQKAMQQAIGEGNDGNNPGYNTPALETEPKLNQTANPIAVD